MPLPKDYMFSEWVLVSKQSKPKPIYAANPESVGWNSNWSALDHLKVPMPNKSITYTDGEAYATFMQATKDRAKSFNYTYQDGTKIRSNIILDLHQEGSTLEALDRFYDIRDGYQI